MLGNDINLHQYWSTSLYSYIPYSPLSSMYSTLQGSATPVLTTTEILIKARDHFDCPDLAGMPYI